MSCASGRDLSEKNIFLTVPLVGTVKTNSFPLDILLACKFQEINLIKIHTERGIMNFMLGKAEALYTVKDGFGYFLRRLLMILVGWGGVGSPPPSLLPLLQ